MRYGEFTNNGMTYKINTPFTPTAWTNYLFNDNYVTEVSQRLQGNGATVDNCNVQQFVGKNRNFYIASDNGVFSLSDIPADFYCEHGIYKTTLHMSQNGISADIRIFVPADKTCEVWTVKISNNTDSMQSVSLYSVFPFSGFDPMGGICRYEDGFMYKYSFPAHTSYEEKSLVENERMYSYVYPSKVPDSYDGDILRFYGCDDYGVKQPKAVKDGFCSNIDGIRMGFFASVMQHKLSLVPNGREEISFVVGKENSIADIKSLMQDFNVDEEYEKTKKIWKKRINTVLINTPDDDINYMTNYWVKKQLILLMRLNRMSAYTPVRNQLQDAIGYSIIEPYEALKFALKVLKRQRNDGFLKQWYMADGSAERGLCFLNHGDGPIWLIMAIIEIIEQCGDTSIYDIEEGYIDSAVKESIYMHLVKAAECIGRMRGEHGLCLMLDGDWTDPVNGVGRLGKGESTWSSEASVYAIDKLAEIAMLRGDSYVWEKLNKISSELKSAVNSHCYKAGYYIAGYDDFGRPFGSDSDDEGRIFLNTQVWAVISGIACDERLASIISIIDKLSTPFGERLLYPPFSKWNEIWGRISVKQAGTSENGSVYNHAVMFKAYSDCVRGDINAAYKTIKNILPTNPLNPPEINGQLPLFISNYYYALDGSPNMGKSSCNYGTGTASWFMWLIIKHIIVKGLSGGSLPDGWRGKCTIERKKYGC